MLLRQRRVCAHLVKTAWVLALFTLSCMPAATPGGAPTSDASAGPPTPKTLTVGLQRETVSFGNFASVSSALAPELVHQLLVFKNARGAFEPQLATEQISVEKGTWVLNPDGSMETTWKIRPGVVWHDGTPLTSADFMLAFTVYKDRDLPSVVRGAMGSMASALAPDPLTFVVHWSQTDVKADQAPGLSPLPVHLIADAYRQDKASLPNNPYFTTQFIGLGPYRLASWESGVQMELARFDGYYRGPAPIDRVIIRYIQDPTALLANILAGAVDVVTPPGLGVDDVFAIEDRGTGHRVIKNVTNSINSAISIQFRPELARPRDGLTNRNVREALYRAIDRQEMAQELTHGLAVLADSWIAPSDAMRPQLEAAVPQYQLDPRRSAQLLTDAGWVRGADGILASSATGEAFRTSVTAPQRSDLQKQQAIISQAWKALGVDAEIDVIPANLYTNDSSLRGKAPGIVLGRIPDNRFVFDGALTIKQIAGPENSWDGRNFGGYTNPAVDDLMNRLGRTIDLRERTALTRQVVQTAMEDLAFFPFYWEVEPVLAAANVKIPAEKTAADYIFEWTKD